MSQLVYYGESPCQSLLKSGLPCRNHAYYVYNQQSVCGVHSKGHKIKLPTNPQAHNNQVIRLSQHQNSIEIMAKNHQVQKITGDVIIYKMSMMKKVDLKTGYLNIFPNYRHESRSDGLGLSSLSPMLLGPINHHQIGLPIALNLENFWHANKVYSNEVDNNQQPNSTFIQTQIQMYTDPQPHRHKTTQHHKDKPLYSQWIDLTGHKHQLTYIESRQIYCYFYEILVTQQPAFHKLQQLMADGYNLQICGYDGYPINTNQSLEQHYLDPTKPFGHERVLYTMLTCLPNDYVWRKYQTLHFT